MDYSLWKALANNAFLLLSLFIAYELSYLISRRNKRIRQIASGFLIALICIAIMSAPFELHPGLVFDTRTILISTTAMIFDPVSTFITVFAAAVYRIIIGGSGLVTGLATIISSALIGLIWRRWFFSKYKNRWLNVYIMGVAVHAVMLACMFFLPYPESLNVIGIIALPVMLIYPVASVLLCMLLLNQRERRHSQEQLKQSEERFQLLFNKAPLGYQSLDSEGNIISVNQQWMDTLGYAHSEVIGKWFGDFLAPGYVETFRERFPLFKKQGHIHSEFEMLSKNGEPKFISFEGKIAYKPDGDFLQTHCILQDITSKRQAEKALKDSEEKYRKLADNISDVVWLTDLSLKITYVSPSVYGLFGESPEQHMSQSLEEKFPTDSLEKIRALFHEEMVNEADPSCPKDRTRVIELEQYRADGTTVWLSIHVSSIRDEHENLIGFQGVSRDISERKLAETTLQRERNTAQLYLDIAYVIFAAFDKKFNVTLINREGCEILGMKKEDIIGSNWVENFVPDSLRDKMTDHFKRLISGETEDYSLYENPIITSEGEERIISWRNVVLRDNDGNISGVLSSGIDITEQKIIEQALRESERSKDVLLSHIPGLAYRCAYDRNWTMHFISDGCYALTGYKPEDFIKNSKLTYNDIICGEYREHLWNRWADIIQAKTTFKEEYEIITAAGERKWVLEMGQPIYGYDGNVDALEGIVIDIDESKHHFNQIKYMSDHDFLTGLYNRKYFEEQKDALDKAGGLPLSIIIADINGVRLINDAFGHAAGDRLIVKTGQIIQKCCEENYILARTGGDEFSMLLPDAGREKANETLASIKAACDEYNSAVEDKARSVNLSLGCGIKQKREQNINDIENEAEENMYKRKLLEQESHHNAIISSVMATMYARSQETEEHAKRLGALSQLIGKAMNLTQKGLDDLELLSMLHDIGKIGIDDRILNKPGKLTEEEWTAMKKHPEIGYRIAMSSPEFKSVAEYILHHHEHWDGSGYPNNISGEDIPMLSRILAVADAYDAMMEDRIYRKAMSKEDAIKEIEENAGTQFDPNIAYLFIQLVRNNC